MIDGYAEVKLVHVATAFASGGLFCLRGLAVQAGFGSAMAWPVRYMSYAVDTVLLSAALVLAATLPTPVFANGWLVAKILLLVAYIGLGTFALKRGKTPRARRWCFAGALLVYGCIVAIALTHHPLGPLILLRRILA